ncbi:type 1 periplasmic binding fold superfamily protein [Nonlabens ponticola]|uniref:Type 1 periplasmic binding fold superfamily protein n=1 Tax=Nonlabens ponticola TaxID=2496866 RepID=A0A3S9MXG8_9FLAO|nr:type 1 periplasmic binding fold superfamily protein [Nonlabens ponticola]AZQ43834.1 type 1 periplasmic binding fold superfamily protein [Nonlabens ponticola]
MKKPIFRYALAALLVTSFVACDDDDDSPEEINPEELITTVEYTLTKTDDDDDDDDNDDDVIVLKAVDNDGDGPDAPVITVSDNLDTNSTYSGNIRFLNESDPGDVENITEEVQDESNDHEVFYASPISGLQITKDDTDNNGNPLGLRTTVTTGAAGTGNLTVTLLHEPNKPNNGTVSNAGGEPDAEVVFPITIED